MEKINPREEWWLSGLTTVRSIKDVLFFQVIKSMRGSMFFAIEVIDELHCDKVTALMKPKQMLHRNIGRISQDLGAQDPR